MFMAAAIIHFRLRKDIEHSLFIYVEGFLIMSIVSGIFLTSYANATYLMSIAGHVINAFAAYFLYKGVVVAGLKRPYDIINHDLDAADNKVKEFEKVIFNNEQCCDFIINNCDNAILIVCENKFVFANNKAAKLLGCEAVEEIVGLELSRLIPDEVRNDSLRRIKEAFNYKKCIPYTESKLLKLDGQTLDVEVTNCYFSYRGKPAIIAMFRDISPQKQIMRLENNIIEEKRISNKTNELNKMLTEFFSNISHELKTPLNVILGAIQILLLPVNCQYNNSVDMRLIKYLKTMKQNCYRLLRLVNNLIDISKFDSGYLKLNLKNYDIVNVVEDIALSVADYVEDKGIELIFDTDVEEKRMAVDVDKIERVILNLLSNAIKFTNGGGQILVNLWDKGESVLIAVKDTREPGETRYCQ
jgi:PAS domain S-box-containing protein